MTQTTILILNEYDFIIGRIRYLKMNFGSSVNISHVPSKSWQWYNIHFNYLTVISILFRTEMVKNLKFNKPRICCKIL